MILFMADATLHLHRHDLPDGLDLGPVIAVDTETMGLDAVSYTHLTLPTKRIV